MAFGDRAFVDVRARAGAQRGGGGDRRGGAGCFLLRGFLGHGGTPRVRKVGRACARPRKRGTRPGPRSLRCGRRRPRRSREAERRGGEEVYVRVDVGGGRIVTKKNK